MSPPRAFIDSNIWLYRFLADQDPDPQADARKRSIAIALTDIEDIVVSTQVINEVCSVLIKLYSEDMQHGLIVSEKLEIVNPFRSFGTML